MRKYFYIDAQNQQRGPVEAQQLPMLGVNPNTYVWTEGMRDWARVVNVPDLKVVFPQLTPESYVPKSKITSTIHPGVGPEYQVTPDFSKEKSTVAEPGYQEKSAIGLLIATYFFAALGGYLGIAFGIAVYFSKEKIYDKQLGTYEKFHKYKKSHRVLGLIGAILSMVSIVIWNYWCPIKN